MSVNVFVINMPDVKKANVNISMFDAFRSKPKAARARKRSQPAAGPAPAAVGTSPPVAAPANGPADATSTAENPKDGTWSKEDDAKLLRLKDTANSTWKNITTQMGDRPIKDVKSRYRHLNRKGKKSGTDKGTAVKPAEGDFIEVMPEHEDGEEDLDVYIDPGAEFNSDSEPEIGMFSEDEWTETETALLEKLNKIYDTNKWLHLASQFFDRTGIRVNPMAVRQKLVGSGSA
ncbi:MAG: hypothetical protein M4579_005783 [Chaenotheca gracillima]|nr:MAG: hypothetical protein M4579_005783 [Chaenotheca gracillima]